MIRKDVDHTRAGRSADTSRWALAIGAALVIGASLTIRYFTGSSPASADTVPAAGARQAAANTRPNTPPANASEIQRSQTIPATVAVVNGQPITREHLGREALKRFGESVLESLVNKHLILQACSERGITISAKDIEDEITRTAGRFKLSVDDWLKMLESERNIKPEQYRRDIIWPMLALKQLAADRLTVTQEQLNREFESEFGPKVQVRMIAVSTREKAERIRQLVLTDPESFSKLAKEESEDPNSAAARGLIPPIRKHVGDERIEQVVFSMQPGDISPILELHGQFLIFKCERHLPATQVSPQHRAIVEEQLRERIAESNLRQAATDLFQELQKDAKVVNVLNDPQLRAQHPGIAALINGRPVTISYLTEECLVRHAEEVLQAEINYLLLQQALKKAGLEITRQDLEQEVAKAAALYNYFDAEGRPDIQGFLAEAAAKEEVEVDYYVRDAVWPTVALKKMVADKVQVTDEDFKKGFESNYGERVEVLAIVVSSQRIAQEVWELARQNPTEEHFRQLAEKYSIEPVSRANLGEVPPIQRHSGQPALEKEAFSLSPNELSGIIAIGEQYVILYCLGRTEPIVTDPEVVREELTRDLYDRKLRLAMAQHFDQLKEKAQIDNFLAGTSQPGESAAVAGGAVRPASGVRGRGQAAPAAPRRR